MKVFQLSINIIPKSTFLKNILIKILILTYAKSLRRALNEYSFYSIKSGLNFCKFKSKLFKILLDSLDFDFLDTLK